MTFEEVESRALRLSPPDRARLACLLLESLDDLVSAENAAVWAEEAQRRAEAWDRDPTVGLSADEVFRKIRASLKTSGPEQS
jgi:putative addiction module component (TIGR02574 family)